MLISGVALRKQPMQWLRAAEPSAETGARGDRNETDLLTVGIRKRSKGEPGFRYM